MRGEWIPGEFGFLDLFVFVSMIVYWMKLGFLGLMRSFGGNVYVYVDLGAESVI